MKGSRKGFKYSIVEKVVETESVPFDQLVDPTVSIASKRNASEISESTRKSADSQKISSSASKKQKASVSKLTSSSSSSSTTTSTSSTKSKQPSRERGKSNDEIKSLPPSDNHSKLSEKQSNKAHFPKIVYDVQRASTFKGSHAEMAISIVKDVCATEKSGLVKYFTKDYPGSNGSEMLDLLGSVTDALADAISSECKEDINFQPELSLSESRQRITLQSTLDKLKARSIELDKYLADPAAFCADKNIWVGPPASAFPQTGAKVDPEVPSISAKYAEVLSDAAQHCTKVLNEIELVQVDLQSSRKVQETVYNSFQKAKFGDHIAPSGFSHVLAATSADTRELIRNLK